MPEPDVFSMSEMKISPRIKFESLRNKLSMVGVLLGKLLESHRIGIYLKGRESGNWALALSTNIDANLEKHAKIINQEKSVELKKAIDSRQPCLLEEILSEHGADGIRCENLILAPMCCDDQVMGLLLADFDAFASLSDRHLIQLDLAAALIKTAIEKEFYGLQISQLKKELQKLSEPKQENIFYNENLIVWLLDREIERTSRHGSAFAILSISIDNLVHLIAENSKRVGESILKDILENLNRLIRKCDFLTRWSGERYMCISLQQNQAGAYVLGEKLRHRVRETEFKVGKKTFSATISIGIAMYPSDEKIPPDAIIARADEALQRAQMRGNCVRLWKKT